MFGFVASPVLSLILAVALRRRRASGIEILLLLRMVAVINQGAKRMKELKSIETNGFLMVLISLTRLKKICWTDNGFWKESRRPPSRWRLFFGDCCHKVRDKPGQIQSEQGNVMRVLNKPYFFPRKECGFEFRKIFHQSKACFIESCRHSSIWLINRKMVYGRDYQKSRKATFEVNMSK